MFRPSRLVNSWKSFGGLLCLHLQVRALQENLLLFDCLNLKMKVKGFFNASGTVHFQIRPKVSQAFPMISINSDGRLALSVVRFTFWMYNAHFSAIRFKFLKYSTHSSTVRLKFRTYSAHSSAVRFKFLKYSTHSSTARLKFRTYSAQSSAVRFKFLKYSTHSSTVRLKYRT